MIVPAVVGLVIYRWFIRRLIRLAGHYTTFLQKLLARGQGAASTILVIIALGLMPLTYFIEKPFQNWTYEGAEQLGSVLLHVDYTVPVDRVRQKLDEIVRQTPLWDGQVAGLQVTDTPEHMVELRALMSARNPGQAWDLRCEVREKLIAFLQAEYPNALPRQRTELVGDLTVAKNSVSN